MLTFTRINRNIRAIRRYRNILGILIKYGFGHFVEQLNISYYLHLGRRIVTFGNAPKEIERLTQPVRLRLAMEELGPTFIKLGQILSTRPDVLPREYIEEFRKLQDKVPSLPVEEIRAQIQLGLGYPVEEIFPEFSPFPIAAASIAQVHRGRLFSGDAVVIKVRRPGIDQVLATDLDILTGLAYLIEHHIPAFRIYNPLALVKEFRRTISREMDFSREGRTIDRFAANFSGDETFHAPNVYWEYTCETVLTMEFVQGIKISEIDRLLAAGLDPKEIARRGADAILKQVLVHGFFHGDPHPGNIYIQENNRVCFLDYGMVGRLTEELKFQLIDLIMAILQRDADRVMRHLLFSSESREDIPTQELKRDISEFIEDYYEVPLHELNTGRLLTDFIEILTNYRIKFPSDLMLLAKALVTIEGIGRQLDPDFNMISHIKPFMKKLLQEKVSPANLSRDFFRTMQGYAALAKNLPEDLKELINRINRNKFKIDLEHRGLERLIVDLDKSSNRISFSMLIASLIIGSSLIMLTDKGPLLLGFPILGFLGYSVAGFLGLWLAVAILRSGRL
ncbi:MAG: AarF/ABC1/UbiB kinase family protein [Desulfuromonadales bacterium]